MIVRAALESRICAKLPLFDDISKTRPGGLRRVHLVLPEVNIFTDIAWS
jgi:hypothetical protein